MRSAAADTPLWAPGPGLAGRASARTAGAPKARGRPPNPGSRGSAPWHAMPDRPTACRPSASGDPSTAGGAGANLAAWPWPVLGQGYGRSHETRGWRWPAAGTLGGGQIAAIRWAHGGALRTVGRSRVRGRAPCGGAGSCRTRRPTRAAGLGRHPQDPPRHPGSPGEPVLRRLLRHLPRRRRHPDGRRSPDGLRARPARAPLHAPLPRPPRHERGRVAPCLVGDCRRERRPHERLPARRRAHRTRLPGERRDLRSRRCARRPGLSHRLGHPQLLGLRPPLCAAGPPLRPRRLREPTRAPLPVLRLVRALPQSARRLDLPEQPRSRHAVGGESQALRLDGHHRAAQPPRRVLGRLPRPWGAAAAGQSGLHAPHRIRPGAPRDRQPSGRAAPVESASGLQRRARRPHADDAQVLRRPARGSAAQGQLATARRPRQRAPPGPGQLGPEPRHTHRQRRHAEPGLALDGDLRHLGRLGRLLRPRGAAAGGRPRLRPPRAGPRDQPVCPPWLRRPPGPELRRLPALHRGRLPGGQAARPGRRRAPRSTPRRAREAASHGQPGGRFRLPTAPAWAAAPACAPAHDAGRAERPAGGRHAFARGARPRRARPAPVGRRQAVSRAPPSL